MSRYYSASQELDRINSEIAKNDSRNPSPIPKQLNTTYTSRTGNATSMSQDYKTTPSTWTSPKLTSSVYTPHRLATPSYTSPGRTESNINISNRSAEITQSSMSASNIISAFKELQAKVKTIENERFIAVRERDSLRHELSTKRRDQALARSKVEIEASEAMLRLRSTSDRLKYECNEADSRVAAQQGILTASTRGLEANRATFQQLQLDIAENHNKIISLERRISFLRNELSNDDERVVKIERTAQASPGKHRKSQVKLHTEVINLQEQVENAEFERRRGEAQLAALHSYMEVVLKINENLCETLVAREEAKAKILKMSERALPPHYSWPKEVPYHSILEIINDAATATVTAVAESGSMKPSGSAVKSLVRALSPSKSPTYTTERKKWQQRPMSAPGKMQFLRQQEAIDPYGTASEKYSRILAEVNGDIFEDDPSVESPAVGFLSNSLKTPTSTSRSRSRGIRKSVARKGAVTSATRFAAAAQAAASAATVHYTPHNSSKRRGRSPVPEKRREPPEDVGSFIPSGRQSREFNIIASVSKASRAAKQLNATLASRVKSLQSNGGGDLFKQVAKVDLEDMRSHLSATKKLNF